jgi:enoyl-CoA hydratase/carnithine racemase
MRYSSLALERHGPVGWLVFDRPSAGNAMDATMLVELETAWRELDDDPTVRVIVNTGAGRVFQTGLDMNQLAGDPDALRVQSQRTKRAELRLTAWHNQVSKPVIAAINGTCAGGGLHFVADADIVIASSNAAFLDPHVSVGQVSAYEPIGLLRKMPAEAVMRMALVGRHERLSAQRALELGMISQVVDPPERLRDEAQRLAETIARNSPAAMAATKRALWQALEERGGRPTSESTSNEPSEEQIVDYSSFESLKVERHGPVGWLINNRPEQLNAMSASMRDELAVAWQQLDGDSSVRVIVHTGEGRAFQTGVDVTEIATDGVGMQRYRQSVEDFDLHFTAWHQQVWKPVITAVNGICAGGGLHWIADADVVMAASDAQFFDPHVSVGQVVSLEAIGLLRKMPAEAVMRMGLVGRYERLSALRALELGMISQVVDPPERLRDEAQRLAETIARNSPAAMATTKRALWQSFELGLTDACRAGAQELASLWGHPDQEEGPRAFAEKREPRWAPPGAATPPAATAGGGTGAPAASEEGGDGASPGAAKPPAAP